MAGSKLPYAVAAVSLGALVYVWTTRGDAEPSSARSEATTSSTTVEDETPGLAASARAALALNLAQKKLGNGNSPERPSVRGVLNDNREHDEEPFR